MKKLLRNLIIRASNWIGISLGDPALNRLVSLNPMSSSGVAVTPNNALELSPVWAAIDKLSNAVASCPIRIYERSADGRKGRECSNHPLLRMLTNPNPHMSAFSFWKSRIVNELLYGYSLSEITYVRGNPDAIWPIRPDTVTIDFRDSVRPFEIKVKGDKYYPPLSQVLYIPRFTLDGTTPISPTKKAEETIGLGLAAEKFEATVFSKGSYPSVLIKHAGRLSKEAKNNIREMWSEEQAGLQQAHAPAVIDEGMDVEKLSFSPQEAEMLGLREFQIREVSRFLGVPPHLLSDLTGATFSNVEQMGLEVLTWSVGPLLIAREQELQRKLLPKGDYLICFDTDGLTPQDRQTRYSTHRESLPWKTVNEVRREEGISELPFSKADAVPTTPGSEYIDDIPLSKDLVNWLQLYNSGKLSATQLQTLAEIAGLKIEADTWTKLLQKESVSDVRA